VESTRPEEALMLARMRARRPSHATVVAYLALFVALGGTGAYAANEWTGANIVDESLTGSDVRGKPGTSTTPSVNGSLTTHEIAGQPANAANGSPFVQGSLTTWDIADGTLRSADVLDNSVGAADLAPGAVNTSEVADNSLSGADIKDQSGVDTCILGTRVGQLCVRVENLARPFDQALQHCANLDVRLPSLSEALELVKTRDIPDVGDTESFWTDQILFIDPSFFAGAVSDDGSYFFGAIEDPFETVCVTTPTN
jgi:hypothetical protein